MSRKHRCPYCRCDEAKFEEPTELPLTLEEALEMLQSPFGDQTWLRRDPWETEAEAADFMSQFSEEHRLRVLASIASAKDREGRLDYEVHLRTGIHKNDVASRRKELVERGWVQPVYDEDGEYVKRKTAKSMGMAWRLTPAGRMVWNHWDQYLEL